jgi:hypothetical protein
VQVRGLEQWPLYGGPVRVVIAVSTGMAAATTGRHGENPPRSIAIVVVAVRQKRWTVGLVPRGLQAVMVIGAGQIRKNWDVLSKTFSLLASGPGRGGQPRAADLTSPRAAESASSTGLGISPGSRPPTTSGARHPHHHLASRHTL